MGTQKPVVEGMDPRYVDAVGSSFEVVKAYWERSTPTFIVKPRNTGFRQSLLKPAFEALADELRPVGYLPKVRWIVDGCHISILDRDEFEAEDCRLNLVLFAATLATVFLDGYIRSSNPVLTEELMKGTPVFVNALMFTFAVTTIFGLHELGHKYVSMRRGVPASLPYFIPAPPGMGGTLGAVITQREPPVNRDALFDLGMAGPLTGVLVTVVMGVDWAAAQLCGALG